MRLSAILLLAAGALVAFVTFTAPYLRGAPQSDAAAAPSLDDAMFDFFAGFIAAGLLTLAGGLLLAHSSTRDKARREATIREQGVAGVATILRMRDTGITVKDDPKVEFGLAIDLPGQPRYEMDTTLQVGRLRVGRLAIGRSFPCSVLPGEPDAIVIDWDTDATIGGGG